MLKDRLQIFIITYNRIKYLQRTFNQIFAYNSPIRNFDITVLDNASNDGTSELIEEYAKKYSNIKHIRHTYNIGGNANICRAFELASSCGKEYAWILCDDDKYDFSSWQEVEKSIEEKNDIICVADYVFPDNSYKKNKAYQIFQLTFVPSIIFRTECITDSVLQNMYDNIYTMFQQTCLVTRVINNDGVIYVLSKPIVFNGMHPNDKADDLSLIRGNIKSLTSERRQITCWILGYCNVLTLIKNNDSLIKDCIEIAIVYKDIYGTWQNFYKCMNKNYLSIKYFNYFYEIFKLLKFKRKIEFIIYYVCGIIRYINAIMECVKFKIKYR